MILTEFYQQPHVPHAISSSARGNQQDARSITCAIQELGRLTHRGEYHYLARQEWPQ